MPFKKFCCLLAIDKEKKPFRGFAARSITPEHRPTTSLGNSAPVTLKVEVNTDQIRSGSSYSFNIYGSLAVSVALDFGGIFITQRTNSL